MHTRISSIDALRGLVMFTMIFVNDLASVGAVVPDWLMHYELRHADANGLTFVDLVFPSFLFIVGMSIPFAVESRLSKGDSRAKVLLHVVIRTLALLFLGVLMVNGSPDATRLGWSPALWQVLMFASAILAFTSFTPRDSSEIDARRWKARSRLLRCVGIALLLWLGAVWVGPKREHLLTLSPFSLRSQWWGILGLIGWDYLVGSVVYLLFRGHRTAMLGCMVLLMVLFAAEQEDVFDGLWLSRVVGIGDTLGSQGGITVAGLLLASILMAADMASTAARVRFTVLFIAGTAAGALLLQDVYGVNKNSATPSYALWACAVSAALWLVFYYLIDVRGKSSQARPLIIAGQNVLLAYLLSEALPFVLELVQWSDAYSSMAQQSLACALARAGACAVILLGITGGLSRMGLRLRL
jgi:predicted acyltransferase